MLLLSYREAKIIDILEYNEDVTWVKVELDNEYAKAINYNNLTGPIKIGNSVILNTTAMELSLGTGGTHFVIHNQNNKSKNLQGKGHIMKLRYTPQQIRCLAAEEENSPYHNIFKEFKSLDNHIFIIGSLHSMLAPIAAMLKYLNEDIKLNYIMTDGGSLPIDFSNTVRDLKSKKLIENTITIGNAFGGDLESTNIYTGLIAAKEILKGDATIITMGPGIVGTGTKYGFSGIEQGQIIDATNTLGGKPILAPRISFEDARERHRGMSHHTRTILSEITKTSARVVLPLLNENKASMLKGQIKALKIDEKHEIVYENGEDVLEALTSYNLNVKTMGRGYEDDLEFFLTLGAVGRNIYKLLKKEDY